MRVISFDPNTVNNFPKLFNDNMYETNDQHIMFIFKDIYDNIKDKEDLASKYETLLKVFDLPYVFYPYYIHFNKVLPDSAAKENPRAHVLLKKFNVVVDIINQPAYGMLILNAEKLKQINFRFNENYKTSFYIQDLIHACFVNNLWISESYFIDLFNSFQLFASKMNDGYRISPESFNKERELFEKNVKMNHEQINDFVEKFKSIYGLNEENKK